MSGQQDIPRTEPRSAAPNYDPFETIGYPSLSFKDRPIGFGYEVQVTGRPEWVQCVDDEGRLAYWENEDGERGREKMAAVTEVRVLTIDGHGAADTDDDDDWQRSVWAVKPSALYHAIRRAVKDTGGIQVGGTLTIVYSGDGPKPASKTKSPQKLYTVTYTPPAGPNSDAPF